jgi:stearoyl-CoA desaturase (delta-9 desaturase)
MPPLQQVVMFCSVVGPFVGLVAAVWLLWRRDAAAGGIGWPEIAVMVGMYALTGFGVTLGFHRLLTHRAFETHRATRLLLAIFGSAGGQGMCIKWCATHRRHHQHADRHGDPHSPHLHGAGPLGLLRGMWHAHVAWVFDADAPGLARSIPDLLADRALLLIDRLYFLWVFLGILIPGAILGLYYGTWMGFISGALWGGVVRIATLQHVTWSINSVCHVWGTRPYNSADDSKNNYPIAVLSLGEGWHNNHHAFPTSARHGLRWWQFDASWCVLLLMKRLGLAWDIRLPSEAALAAKRRG